MKKYIISTVVAFATLSAVSAQVATNEAPQMMPALMTTGDAALDLQIKDSHKEMEAKIKAIREEYQAKIKALIGDKKVLNRHPMASTTEKIMMRQEMGDKRGVRGSSSMATSSERRPMMGKKDGQNMEGEVSTRPEGEKKQNQGLFSKYFSR